MTLIFFSYSTTDQNRCHWCVKKIKKNKIEIAVHFKRTDLVPNVKYFHEKCFTVGRTALIILPEISGLQGLSEPDQVRIFEKLQGLFINLPMEFV